MGGDLLLKVKISILVIYGSGAASENWMRQAAAPVRQDIFISNQKNPVCMQV